MNSNYPKDYFEKLARRVQSGTAFVLIPFHPDFLNVFDTISEALSQLSPPMRVTRAADLTSGGSIITEILAGIAEADFIIADMTGRNPNVFYELGISHTVKTDVILISQSIEDIPFDLRHLRCIKYENSHAGLQDLSPKLRKCLRELMISRQQSGKIELLANIAQSASLRASDWFSARLNILKGIAEWPEFQINDAQAHDQALGKAAAVLWEFGGGVYTLDFGGNILSSFPLDIRGQNYSHREYFRLCSERRTGIVSNSFDSANRDHTISVIATPRFDSSGKFLGILDAVIDIGESPLNKIMYPTVPTRSTGTDVQVLLVDQRQVVIAANTPYLAGKNVGGNSIVSSAFEALQKGRQMEFLSHQPAVAALVENTPFRLITIAGELTW